MAERDDKSFRSSKEFFATADGYKTYFEVAHLGHGTDALYRDAGLPTVLLAWLENLETAVPAVRQIRHFQSVVPIKKK
jgi:hypothetical protein